MLAMLHPASRTAQWLAKFGWPVLSGAADWHLDRVTPLGGGYGSPVPLAGRGRREAPRASRGHVDGAARGGGKHAIPPMLAHPAPFRLRWLPRAFSVKGVLPIDEWCVGSGCGCESPGVDDDAHTNAVVRLSLLKAAQAAQVRVWGRRITHRPCGGW
jgi:hypothetical protein